jgi:integrase
VAKVAEDFIQRSLAGRNRSASYVTATRRMFDEHMLPRWRNRDIGSITRRDVVALLDGIVDDGKPVLANRMLAAVRAMFNWAIRRGIVDTSPATLVERPAAEKPRERILSAEEIRALWPQFDALGYPFGPFFQMALVTGQRREEVARMSWADIDAEERTWSLSASQTKARRAHVVPLSQIALEILMKAKEGAQSTLEEAEARTARFERAATKRAGAKNGIRAKVRRAKMDSAFVFTSFTTTEDRPISGFGKAKARIDRAIDKTRAKEGLKPFAPWTVHDLRRTAASGFGQLGVSRFIISRVLNHTDSSVTGIYDRHAYLVEKRHALENWSTYVGNLIQPPGANVVELRTEA